MTAADFEKRPILAEIRPVLAVQKIKTANVFGLWIQQRNCPIGRFGRFYT
jgi:hypothetical protein